MKRALDVKLYKFRGLVEKEEFSRAEEIIKTGKLYCAPFTELNDPMEGVYKFKYKRNIIKDIYNEKQSYRICCLSGEKALLKIPMWGYYANGFKGVAIEFEVKEKHHLPTKVNYKKKLIEFKDQCVKDFVQSVLTMKFLDWEHEEEYRFLFKDSDNKENGSITGIYFSKIESIFYNSHEINQSNNMNKYVINKKALINTINELNNDNDKEILMYDVWFDSNKEALTFDRIIE
ncbi:hypothetical protein KAI78_08260 [bacterium]|nr:hypothetical protein [bacterium]